MNPMRNMTIRRVILETLKHAHGYAVPEQALRPQVDAMLRPPTTEEEWAYNTDFLTGQPIGAMTAVPSALDESIVQWAITERGRVLLASI